MRVISGFGDDIPGNALELRADFKDAPDLSRLLVLQLSEEFDKGLHETQVGAGARVGRGMDDVCEEGEKCGDGEVEHPPECVLERM